MGTLRVTGFREAVCMIIGQPLPRAVLQQPPTTITVPPAGTISPPIVQRIGGILLFAASFALAAYVVMNKHGVDHVLHAVGPLRIPLAVLIFAVVASAPFSVTDALAVSNGVLFGPWIGTAVNALGLVLAAIIGYAIARRTSKLLNIEAQVEKLPARIKRLQIGSPLFLIAVRMIPGMGGTIATQTAAAMRVPIWRQIYTMCAVTVPVCTMLAFGGHFVSSYVEMHLVQPAERYAAKHHLHLPRVQHPVTVTQP
jgi:uncharacterized membrane protein YdjX (TVP38/TMEM64 family)